MRFTIRSELVVLLLAAALPVLAAASGDAARIEGLLGDDRIDEAVAAAREALKTAPDDPDLHMALAQALAAKGRRVERVVGTRIDLKGLASGKRVLPAPDDLNGGRPQVLYDPALFDQAFEEVREAIRLAPHRKDLRFSECYLLTDAGKITQAVDAIRELTQDFPAEPGLASVLASYGSERAKRADFAGAATLLGVVVSAFPGDAAAQADYGSALARSGKRDEGLAALDRAVELRPADVDLHRKRALVSLMLLDFVRARDAFLAAYRIDQKDSDRLGAAAAAFGRDPQSAAFDLEELSVPAASGDAYAARLADGFLNAVPEKTAPRLTLARLLVSSGHEALAVPVLHRILRKEPEQAEALEMRQRIYREMEFPLPAGSSR